MLKTSRNHRPPQQCSKRASGVARAKRGTAVVELAICMPILTLVLFGTVEACRMIQLQQDLSVIAYEGARIGTIPGATSTAVQTQCDLMLEDRGITGHNISITPEVSSLTPGQYLTVTVTADCSANSLFGTTMYQGDVMTQTCVMRAP